jgi:hypothetical protein
MPSGIEPEVTKFMWRIVRTLSTGLLWMLLQVVAGIMPGYAFVEGRLTWWNVGYYLFFLISLGALIYYFYRLWRHEDADGGSGRL